MRQGTIWLSSLAAGATTAFLFDPVSGNRRRKRIGHAFVRAANRSGEAAEKVGRDLRNRSIGIAATARRAMHHDAPNDAVLHERVRSALGRASSHPHAIKVDVRNGDVILTGPILESEEARALSAVRAVPGVKNVAGQFERHKHANGIPSLQGSPSRRRMSPSLDVLQRSWAPATRAVVGTSGAALMAFGLSRRNPAGLALAGAGAALVARAVTNAELRRLFGFEGRRAVDVQKAITINAPVDRVYGFWDNFENFPKFMRHVREVRPTKEPAQWHWVVSGPATAAPVEFDAVVTERIPNGVLAWKTTDSSMVRHAGLVRFDPIGPQRTRVQIRMSYNPPGGAIGHGVLALLGGDLKSRINEDLVRVKTTLETGRPPHDAAAASARSVL